MHVQCVEKKILSRTYIFLNNLRNIRFVAINKISLGSKIGKKLCEVILQRMKKFTTVLQCSIEIVEMLSFLDIKEYRNILPKQILFHTYNQHPWIKHYNKQKRPNSTIWKSLKYVIELRGKLWRKSSMNFVSLLQSHRIYTGNCFCTGKLSS